jgi:hypothetical protein
MIIIIFRIRKAIRGAKVNIKRTIVFSAYFIAITCFLVYNSFLIGALPAVYYVVPYFAIAAGATYCSYIYSKRTLLFRKSPNGDTGNSAIYTQGGLSVYLIYILALTMRIAINFLFIGSDKFYFNNQGSMLANGTTIDIMPLFRTDPVTTTLAFVATDFLLVIGAGLLVGRNSRIIEYHYREKGYVK